MRLSYQVSLTEKKENSEGTYMEGDFEQNLLFLKSLGYEAVELMVREPEKIDCSNVKKILERCEMDAAMVCTGEMGVNGCDLTNPDLQIRESSVRKVQKAIDIAEYLGTNINAGKVKGSFKKGIPKGQTLSWAVENFQRLSEYAEKKQVAIALETAAFFYNNFINTCEEAYALIEAVGRSNFGLMLDIFHMNIEEKNLYKTVSRYGKDALHVHLADNNRKYPGSGGIDFEQIFNLLKQQGYRGEFTIEARQFPDSKIAAKKAAEQLLPILKAL